MKALSLILLFLSFLLYASPLDVSAQQGTIPPALESPSMQNASGSSASSNIGMASIDAMGVRGYKLNTGDVLNLRVFGEPQFSGDLEVDDEGNIEVPFVDDPIVARCRTDREVRHEITESLRKYLQNPKVSLRIINAKSRPPATVFGAVRQPARVQMQRRVRLLELLAVSGGVTEQNGGDIQIFHTEPLMCPEPGDEDSVEKVASLAELQIPFALYNIDDLKLGKPEANPVIRPGDIVIVPEAKPIYITGAVVSPQGVYLRPQTSLTLALAQVGGVRKDARSSKVRIYRRKPNSMEQEVITIDYKLVREKKAPDVELKPYDIVEVAEPSDFSPSKLLQMVLGGASNAITNSGAALSNRVIY